MKSLLRLALAVGGAFLVSALMVTACVVVSRHGVDLNFSHVDWTEKAERTDARDLPLQAGQTLRAETPYGEIRVHGTSGSSASMRATIRAPGRTQAEAQALLDRTTIVVDETGRGVALRVDVKRQAGEERNQAQPAVDFEIEVPAGVALELVSRSGLLQAEGGPFASARLESHYGNVEVDNVRGDVVATSKSGKVDVAHVTKGTVEATSGYGAVSVADVDGGSVSAKSSSGAVRLSRVRAPRASAESGYGAVDLRDIDVVREVEGSSKSGKVTAEAVKAERVHLSSGYGSIRVKQVQGDLALETSSGSISVDDVHARLAARTGYGSIDADGVFSGLALESKSGSVKAHARAGSKVESEWSLQSSYGRVELLAPKDIAFDLAAKTGYGEIEVGYALEVAPGTLSKKGREVQGRVNGGGKTVRLQSSSGSVVVTPAGN